MKSVPKQFFLHNRLATQASVPEYEKMSKAALFNKLQEQYDLQRLMRLEARKGKEPPGSKKRSRESNDNIQSDDAEPVKQAPKKKLKLNTIDPIMFTPIKKKNVFNYIRPNGTTVRFNVESLVDYLLTSGDFTDPETRIPFTDDNLREIDDIVSYSLVSVYLLIYSYRPKRRH